MAAGDEPKWRVRTRKVEERAVDFVDDAYGEYYQLAVRGGRQRAGWAGGLSLGGEV